MAASHETSLIQPLIKAQSASRAPQRATVDLAAIREQVCERADVFSLALQAGFRRAKGRPKSFHCIHGEDRTPSAHEYRGRIKCFGCGGSWSAIDLAMLVNGCTYVEALKLLAVETSTPWPHQTPAERLRLQKARHAAPDLAQQIADWAHGISLTMGRYKSSLVMCADWASRNGIDALSLYALGQLEQIPRAFLSPDTADPRSLAKAYRICLNGNSDAVVRIREFGRKDREHAEQFTHEIVRMLVAATDMNRSAAA